MGVAKMGRPVVYKAVSETYFCPFSGYEYWGWLCLVFDKDPYSTLLMLNNQKFYAQHNYLLLLLLLIS